MIVHELLCKTLCVEWIVLFKTHVAGESACFLERMAFQGMRFGNFFTRAVQTQACRIVLLITVFGEIA